MRKRTVTQFNCFSPPVMIATIIIELTAALYTAFRYKLNSVGRLVTLTLIFLATFQLAEFNVCTGHLGSASLWSRLGFAAITVLPPLGVHLMYVLAGRPERKLIAIAYTTMAAYIAIYLLLPNAFVSHHCTGNYVIFHLRENLGGTFWVYYFGWLLTGIYQGVKWIGDIKAAGKKAQQQINNMQALMIGWMIFIVPTAIANIAKPETVQAIPSIMCGFAVLFALILVFYILPNAGTKKLDNKAK